jgi:hypothetical protein
MKNRTAPNQFMPRTDWRDVFMNVAVVAIVAATVMLCAVMLSCTPQARSTMSGTFAACADSDLGTLIAPGITVAGDVAGLIESNAPTLEADLTSLAVTVGIDAVECAIAAVEAVLLAPKPATGSAGSGELVASAKAPPPGVARARAWLGDARAKARAAKAGAP